MELVKQWCYLVFFCLSMWSLMVAEASHRHNPEKDSIRAIHPISHVRRTGYHFQPPQHWINDPNGPMYYNGIYHLFYQYNPNGSVWGNIVWAHSVSEDLINWISLKPAISPSKEFDMQGCWSGSATILPGNKPVLFYTGLDPQYNQVQNLAFPANLSDPYLRDWIKPDFNPVIVPGPETNTSAFRDPTTAWWNRGYWKTVVGSRDNGLTGTAYLYKSKDFKKWVRAEEPLHKMENTGMWECPDFYPVRVRSGRKSGLETSVVGDGVKHVLKVSLDLTRFEYYTIGKYDLVKDKYVPDEGMVDGWDGLRYDYGNFYASKTFFDERGKRRILWGWANESDAQSDDVKKGWAGIQLIPREIWLDPNGKQLLQWPIAEIELLRQTPVKLRQMKLNVGDVQEIKGVTAAQADVEVVFKLPQSLDNAEPFDPSWVNAQDLCAQKGSTVQGGIGPFGLLTLASEELEENTPVFFRIFKSQEKKNNTTHVVLMCSDASRSTLQPDPCMTKPECMYKPSFAGFVNVDLKDRKLPLRSLIDHSVVESFGAKGKTCITSRVYPTKAIGDNAHLYVFNYGIEPIVVEKLEAWSMQKPLKMNQPLDEISF